MRVTRIGFEWESRIPKSSFSDGKIDRIIYELRELFPVVKRWHNDGQNREFEAEPQRYSDKEWIRFESIQEVCKEVFGDEYELKSLHCHIDSSENLGKQKLERYLWKNIFYLTMPIAWIIRCAKQTSLVDAGTQWVNIPSPMSKGLLCVHPYGYYNWGLELRFAGKFWKEYIPIVKSIDSLLRSFNLDFNILDKKQKKYGIDEINRIFTKFPDTYYEQLKKNINAAHLMPYIFDKNKNIWKQLYTDLQIRKGSASMIGMAFGFIFLFPHYKNYFPKTVKYIDEFIIPNFNDIILDKVRQLKKNYKFPYLRAWKDILKDIGKLGCKELDTAFTSLKYAEPLVPVESKHVTHTRGRKTFKIYVPDVSINVDYDTLSKEINKKNWRFSCKYSDGCKDTRSLILRLCKDTCLQMAGYEDINVCCVTCPFTKQKDIKGVPFCEKQCTKKTDLRAERKVVKSKWTIKDLGINTRFLYPSETEFCICHDCRGYCETCECKDCDKKFNYNACGSCSSVKIGGRWYMKSWNNFGLVTQTTINQITNILSRCSNFIIHQSFGLYQCNLRTCKLGLGQEGKQYCCYLCRYVKNCEDRCDRLGSDLNEFCGSCGEIRINNKNMNDELRERVMAEAKIKFDEDFLRLRKIIDDLTNRVHTSRAYSSGTCDSYCSVRHGDCETCEECENKTTQRCLRCSFDAYYSRDGINERRMCQNCEFEKDNDFFVCYNSSTKQLEPYCNDEWIRTLRKRRTQTWYNSSPSLTISLNTDLNTCRTCCGTINREEENYVGCHLCNNIMHDTSECVWFCDICEEAFCPSCEHTLDEHVCRECNPNEDDDLEEIYEEEIMDEGEDIFDI